MLACACCSCGGVFPGSCRHSMVWQRRHTGRIQDYQGFHIPPEHLRGCGSEALECHTGQHFHKVSFFILHAPEYSLGLFVMWSYWQKTVAGLCSFVFCWLGLWSTGTGRPASSPTWLSPSPPSPSPHQNSSLNRPTRQKYYISSILRRKRKSRRTKVVQCHD